LFIVDIGHEHIALAEAKRLGVGTFGVVDTNCDPNKVDFAIPANDDATKSIAIITQYITAAIAEGLAERQAAKDEETDDASLSDENQKKAARMEAEAQAEAGGGGKPVVVVNQDVVHQAAQREQVTGKPNPLSP
jgi:small subunit ribosomal protein S2